MTRTPGPGAPTTSSTLVTDTSVEGRIMHVLLQGAADLRAQEQLTQFLERLHLRAVESGAREARVDLTGLTFMSSSCLAALVHWIEAAQGAQAPYQIHFLANYSHRWQSRSLEALRCLAVELVHLTVA